MNLQLHLNSSFADTYDNADPNMHSQLTWHLNNILPSKLTRRQRMYVSVMSATIPATFLNCDYYNNKFVYYDHSNVKQTIYITEGNYNVATLAKWMTDNTSFTFTYNALTNHYYIQAHPSQTWTWSPESTCQELFGIDYTTNYQSDVHGLLESNIAINFFTIRNILVLCPNLITGNVFDSRLNNRSCLINIPVTAGANSVITYQNNNKIRTEIDSFTNFNNFQLILLDQDGDMLDLNGSHWSISLFFEIE